MIPKDMVIGTKHPTKVNGALEVVQYTSSTNVLVRFLSTGYERETTTRAIREGKVKDYYRPAVVGVGYLGIGPYSFNEDRVAYRAWTNMLRRCYDEKQRFRNPTYADCSVAEEWHDFQNFAEWFNSQNNSHTPGFELDKDIKVKNNKVYSPETCLIVRAEHNSGHRHENSSK